MSTYYEYEDVKRKMVHRLFKMGWKIYGHHADQSDLMTDYYDPEYWCGVAEKNGYILVVNDSFGLKEDRVYRSYTTVTLDAEVKEKIEKLERVTMEHGASEAEEKTAKEKIAALKEKANGGQEQVAKEVVYEPKHMANPERCNWHIEKDGVIIEKGTGLLKFADVLDITRDRDMEEVQAFNSMDEAGFKKYYAEKVFLHSMWCNKMEDAERDANYKYEQLKKEIALLNKFNALMSKIDAAAGSMVGNAEYEFKKVKEQIKKTVKVAKVSGNGKIADGQCFKVNGCFTGGIRKGSIYRIHTQDGYVKAFKLNGKLTKECTGTADWSNCWWIGKDTSKFEKWIERGSLVWVDVVDEIQVSEIEKIKKVKVS